MRGRLGKSDIHPQMQKGKMKYTLPGNSGLRVSELVLAPVSTYPKTDFSKPPLTIRFHLTDGSVHSFVQADTTINEKLWDTIEPSRLFAHQRIVVGSEHSKSVFVAAEIIRVDLLHASFQCWKFPGGYSDIVEVSEEEFRKHA